MIFSLFTYSFPLNYGKEIKKGRGEFFQIIWRESEVNWPGSDWAPAGTLRVFCSRGKRG